MKALPHRYQFVADKDAVGLFHTPNSSDMAGHYYHHLRLYAMRCHSLRHL
nr:MAG TPA: hypothetical protein [Caudoviricetes sp.]